MGLRARLFFSSGAAVLLLAGCGGSGAMSADSLARQASSLQSAAAEGALLARVAAAGHSTSAYRREQAHVLRDQASRVGAALEFGETGRSLRRDRLRLAVLAGRIGTDLDALSHASDAESASLSARLRAAAEQAKRVRQGLE